MPSPSVDLGREGFGTRLGVLLRWMLSTRSESERPCFGTLHPHDPASVAVDSEGLLLFDSEGCSRHCHGFHAYFFLPLGMWCYFLVYHGHLELCNHPWPPWGSSGDGKVASSSCMSLLPARGLRARCSEVRVVPRVCSKVFWSQCVFQCSALVGGGGGGCSWSWCVFWRSALVGATTRAGVLPWSDLTENSIYKP